MAKASAVPTKGGKPIKNAVTVVLSNGQVFDGWKSVSITRNLDSVASSFSMDLHDRFLPFKQNWPLKPGIQIKINIGTTRVLTGRIEKLDAAYAPGSRTLTISGRSLTGDIVDAGIDGPAEYTNLSIKELAELLVKPFGLKVFLSVEEGEHFEKFAVKPGESVFEALDRAARTRGFFWIATHGGNLRLTRAARDRALSELHQDVNIKGADVSIDSSQRHDRYIVRGQTSASDDFGFQNASEAEGEAKDLGITRHRPLILIAEAAVNTAQAQQRADWENSVRVAKGTNINVQVQNWVQKDGKTLWDINQIMHVHAPFIGINGDFLSQNVVYNQSNSGTVADITLVRKDSYTPQPEVPKRDDITELLGQGGH